MEEWAPEELSGPELWPKLQALAASARSARRAAFKSSSLRALTKATNRCPWLLTAVSPQDIKTWIYGDPSTLELPHIPKQIYALICVLCDWADESLDHDEWIGLISLAQLREMGILEKISNLHLEFSGERQLMSLAQRLNKTQFPAASALPEWEAGAAVLVGVHSYEHLKNVNSIENNIRTLKELVTSPDFGIPLERCFIVENPTDPRMVFKALDAAFQSGAESLFFYYAGHGLAHPISGRLLLSVADSRKHAYYSYLEFDRLREHIAECGLSRRLVVIDSCYSGAGLDTLSPLADGVTAIRGSYVMTSSAATEQSLAPEGAEFTTFTGELIKALEDGVPGAGKVLSAESVFKFVKTQCEAQGFPTPSRQVRDGGDSIMLTENPFLRKEAAIESMISGIAHEDRTVLIAALEQWVKDVGHLAVLGKFVHGDDEPEAAKQEMDKRLRQAWTLLKRYKPLEGSEEEASQRKADRKIRKRFATIGVAIVLTLAIALVPICIIFDVWSIYTPLMVCAIGAALTAEVSFRRGRDSSKAFVEGMEARWKLDRKL
ncbi:caspase domain-containing protein [Streptomyces sp. 3211.6]|uniref:caspase family protein n=1 Tax=Streptomyces sp. 3211.6 TaxID=1938845 RepID=UPI000EB1731A|nr:caspase family protein [Streptomyces sp. 3211.6]RKT08188.1 caspase domain-containing protein [Streptomyces sp. 3211.6]